MKKLEKRNLYNGEWRIEERRPVRVYGKRFSTVRRLSQHEIIRRWRFLGIQVRNRTIDVSAHNSKIVDFSISMNYVRNIVQTCPVLTYFLPLHARSQSRICGTPTEKEKSILDRKIFFEFEYANPVDSMFWRIILKKIER